MRILCVGNRYPPWSLGGYEVVWAEAVRSLRDRGHQVRVLTTGPDPSDAPDPAQPPDDVHRDLGWYWREHAFPALSLGQALALERANGAALERHLSEHQPDAVLWWAMGGMSLSLVERVRRAGIPALGLVGDEWMAYGPRVDGWIRRWRGWRRPAAGLAERHYGIPTRANLDTGAKWLFNSAYLLQAAHQAGWRLPRAGILAPGVDLHRFAPRPPRTWGWRLLYCGRLDPRKGVASAVQALARLPAAARLSVVGDGDPANVEELRKLALSLGVASRLSFSRLDHHQVPEAYAAADTLLFPVLWREPWGLVPLEAMAVGRPVVASRAGGGPAEYLREGVNCLQFEPGDGGQLAAAVTRLAADAQLRGRLVEHGHRTSSRYTWQAYLDGLERELQAAVAE